MMTVFDVLLGCSGSILLAISGIPQVFRSLKMKNVTGLSPYSLSCVCLGCISMNIFVFRYEGLSLLNISYSFNAIVSLTNLILYLRYKK